MNATRPFILTFRSEGYPLPRAVGIAPLGYTKIMGNEGVRIVPDEEIAPHVVQIFEWAAKGKPYREILVFLKYQGLKSSRGNDLSLSSLHNMLTNPFYMGIVRRNGVTFDDSHRPLVSKSLFRRVQISLRKRRQ